MPYSVPVNVWLQSVLSTDQNSLRKILISCLPMHCGSRIKTSSERNDVMQNLTFLSLFNVLCIDVGDLLSDIISLSLAKYLG